MDTSLRPEYFAGVTNASELIAELEAYLSLHFPCLATLPAEKALLLKDILAPVIRRWAALGAGVGGHSVTGPFQDQRPVGLHTLHDHEAASLRKLCGESAPPGGLPQGSFPPAEPIDDLFVRRPGWPTLEKA